MSKDILDIEKEIQTAIRNLIEVVRVNCWNTISRNYTFLLSEINEKDKITENENNLFKSLEEVLLELSKIYFSIYDLNFYVYKSSKNETIIEIKYFLKTSLDKGFYENIADKKPMIHSKLEIPPYRENEFQKFDVNWTLGGYRYQWKMFWCNLKFRVKYRKRIKSLDKTSIDLRER